MFSSRTDWNLSTNHLTRLLREMLLRGETILDLTESNPTACGLGPPAKFIGQLAATPILSYAPDPKGLITARKAICGYYETLGAVVEPESIILTSSTSEAYSFLFRLLCNPGDQLLVPRPGYPLFDILGDLHDVDIRRYELLYDGEWHVDLKSLESTLNPKVKAILLMHPSNPTGSFVKNAESEFLAACAAQTGIPLIVDEVFYRFLVDPGADIPRTFAGRSNIPLVVLNGLSKLAGLPQLKLAWMIVNGPESWRGKALERLEMISDAFLSVSTISQAVLPNILEDIDSFSKPLQERITLNRRFLQSSPPAGCTVLRSEGGWNAMLRVPATRSDEQWSISLLAEMKILVHPGCLFDAEKETYLILSLLPPPETFRTALQQISLFFQRV